ncbi:MAG: glucosyltransferase domain-containing protein [Bacilli bacterium]
MENKLIKLYKENKTLILVLTFISFLTFGFYALNTILNIDGVTDLILIDKANSAQTYLSVGRWGWAFITKIFNYYPNALFFWFINTIFFIGSTLLISKIFNITNKFHQILLGAFLIVFPINSYAYSYTSWQYSLGIGIFISVLSIYLVKFKKNNLYILLSILCISFAIGLYQSFLPFIIVLFLFLCILDIDKNIKTKDLIKKYLTYILILVGGIILYVVLSKLFVTIFNIKWNSYQGASSMFKFDIKVFIDNFIPNITRSLKINNKYFFPSFSVYILILISLYSFIINIFNINKKHIILYILITICLILAPNTLAFIKPYAWYHTLTLIPYLPLSLGFICLLFKNNNKLKYINKYVTPLIIFIACIFMFYDNKMAYMAKLTSDASFHYMNRMQMRIEELDGYKPLGYTKKIYFVGSYKDFEFPYSKAYVTEVGPTFSFVHGNIALENALNVLGDSYELVNDKISKEENDKIILSSSNKDVYPKENSIYMYEDIIVVKIR